MYSVSNESMKFPFYNPLLGDLHLVSNIGRIKFEALCFEFGIELDDVQTEGGEIIYKIEVAANRYDLLCIEGIAQALRVFVGMGEIPVFTVSDIQRSSMLKLHVKPETSSIRPFVVCAVLRGITFDEARYNSFIDLQEKLHQNVCRRRTLVAIGTHDLDKLQPPFTYEALSPKEINFVPLKQVKSFRGDELMEYYRSSEDKLKKFLHIIENSPVFPVIYDSNRTVLSLPPIINGAHSAISFGTKNVFIECTATDLTRAKIVLNTMVTMFSEYCERKFEVEPVEVVYSESKASIYPDLSVTSMEAKLSEITGPIGVLLGIAEVTTLLNKMQLQSKQSSLKSGECSIVVSVPPTRSDILHARDVTEDVAIAYGYNNIPKSKPKCMTTGGRQPLNRFSDKIRTEVFGAGYTEVLTWVLGSREENFTMLKREEDEKKAVIIENYRSSEFEVVRTSLMSCLLKTLRHNVDHPKPIKIFEMGDVVTLDGEQDVGAANNRRLAVLYCNSQSGFEEILGLVGRIMNIVRTSDMKVTDDYIRPSDEPEFFPNRQCSITLKGKEIGKFGIVHPEVLENFTIPYPCSFLEIDIQALL